jgi:hypothetical protein
MSQADLIIENQSFPSFRADLNNSLSALNSMHSGTSRPASAVAGTMWLDTTNATNPTIKFFDGTDDITFATVDYSANTINFSDSASDLLTDTTPQLGGDLDLNSNDITGTGDISITGTILPTKAYIAETTLTDGATIDWDMATESVAKVTLGGNRTLNEPTNGSTGQFCSLLIIQDGTGSRTLTWNAVFEFTTDTAPTLTTTAGLADLFTFRYNGTKWLEVGRNLTLTVA